MLPRRSLRCSYLDDFIRSGNPIGVLALLGALLSCLLGLSACHTRHNRRPAADLGPELGQPTFPAPPPREPGPPLAETPAQLEAAAREAAGITRSLVAGGVPSREVASVADLRGYRLYRRRAFGQALAWFRAAVAVDPAFELSLYNAARCEALLGKLDGAAQLLERLQALGTPLARARLGLVRADPDLRALPPSR